MAMLSEVLDAVVGADTHRDTNQVEIAYPSGAVIATNSFGNDSGGHAEALAWTLKHAPGPRLVLSIEGTRSYGAGLARAAREGPAARGPGSDTAVSGTDHRRADGVVYDTSMGHASDCCGRRSVLACSPVLH